MLEKLIVAPKTSDKMFQIISQNIFYLMLVWITNVATIKVLTSPSSKQTTVEIPESDVSDLDGFTVCFRVFSHQFNKYFNPLITLSQPNGASNPIQFGTVVTPCHFVSGKTQLLAL